MAGFKGFIRAASLYGVVGSTIPYIKKKELSTPMREQFDRQNIYGSYEPGPDRICVIETPRDALNIRLELVRNAEVSLDIVCYSMVRSACTDAFLGEILMAADRGVRVQILLDGKGCGAKMREAMAALAGHANISVRLYNPLKWYKPWNFHAGLHDKFIIVDHHMLLLGGRNMDERHYAPVEFLGPVTHDRDVFVWSQRRNAESVIMQTVEYMEELSDQKYTVLLTAKERKKEAGRIIQAECHRAANQLPYTNPQFYTATLETYKQRTVPSAKITLIHNPVHTRKKEPWLGYQLYGLAKTAKKNVIIQTPYATGNKELLAALQEIHQQAKLTILTNSMESSPNYPAFSNYYAQRSSFLATGAALYEYQGQNSIHGKSWLIDDRISAVGSFNLDDRSIYINTESMLVIDSPAFAEQLANVMQDIRRQSLQVGDDNQYIPDQSVKTKGAPKEKERFMRFVYWVLRPFQYFL